MHASVKHLLEQVGTVPARLMSPRCTPSSSEPAEPSLTFPGLLAFLPELVLLAGALGSSSSASANGASAWPATPRSGWRWRRSPRLRRCLRQEAVLFDGAYRVDAFSQWLKLVFAGGYLLVAPAQRRPAGHPGGRQARVLPVPRVSVTGLTCWSAASTHHARHRARALLVPALPHGPMRRERPASASDGVRHQVHHVRHRANGIMLFGMSYLFGLTGTTSLPE
jgi:NADH-quinone oxidoreductase subunit N